MLEDKVKMADEIKRHVDLGVTLLYSHGGATDGYMMKGGKIETIGQMLDLIKAQGVPAGVGGHSLNMPIECEKAKLNVDFYIKTLHMDRYWSATPKDRRVEYDWMDMHSDDHDANNDNMWCNNPEETAAFMETVEKPWIAFKVMAAGAIPPEDAFQYVFNNGADFSLAGMFDFEIEKDVAIARKVLAGVQRTRPWRAPAV